MPGEATGSSEVAHVVAASSERNEGSLLSEPIADTEGAQLEGSGRVAGREDGGGGERGGDAKESEKGAGRPQLKRAALGVGKQQSTQDFFRHGTGNHSMHCIEDCDDAFATPGKTVMREHSHALSQRQRAAHSRWAERDST